MPMKELNYLDKNINVEAVSDATAENLESLGLWRRASAHWLCLMDCTSLSEIQREWIRQRRNYCSRMALKYTK